MVNQLFEFKYHALCFIMISSICMIGYTKLNIIHMDNRALAIMEAQGGYTPQVEQYIKSYCSEHNLDFSKLEITATPYPVNYNEDIQLSLTYTYISGNILGNRPFLITASQSIGSEFIIR